MESTLRDKLVEMIRASSTEDTALGVVSSRYYVGVARIKDGKPTLTVRGVSDKGAGEQALRQAHELNENGTFLHGIVFDTACRLTVFEREAEKPETPTLTRYHFSFGNSSDGPIGFCAAVWAENEAEAVEMLRERVEGTERSIDEDDDIDSDAGDQKGIEYVNVYFGDAKAITVAGIDETEEAQ